MYPARVHYTGTKTGRRYTWDWAGSIIDVFEEDLEDLLKKKTRPCVTCHGSAEEIPIFEVR
jgi:hypothetical protein